MRDRFFALGFLLVGLCADDRLAWGRDPSIAVLSYPAYGGSEGVRGVVLGANPSAYRLTVIIQISGLGAYSKPYCDASFRFAQPVSIGVDGTFVAPIVTGGVDSTATGIALYLLPPGTIVPCYFGVDGFPAALKDMAVATAFISRPAPRQVSFSGFLFDVKSNSAPLGPGPCLFSDSPDNVWTDGLGRLHLKITNRNGQWYCAEIYTRKILGYGTYSVKIETPPCAADPRAVLGFFLWNDTDASSAHREIDIEFSRWGQVGDANCEQFVIQPADAPGHLMRFPFTAGAGSTHSFQYLPGQVNFSAATAGGTVVTQWTDTTDVPAAFGQQARINLWYTGAPPAGEVEVVIDSFEFRSSAPAKAGIFRGGLWLSDADGNGRWEGPPVDTASFLGQQDDVPITGDWTGNGRARIGIFRAGLWVLDMNGNGQWDGPAIDRFFYFGQAGDVPVVGDWDGNGRTKLGIFRNGQWLLDYNGNGVWDGASQDAVCALGQAGDKPVIGDWSGDGRSKIGVFRDGLWVLDYNGDGQWNGPVGDTFFYLGQAGDTPVLGDWNTDGRDKAGVFRAGLWVLDYNGSGRWDGPGADRFFYLGQSGDTPVVGDWGGSGRATGGVFRAGLWVLDKNGNGQWDGPPDDTFFYLGQAGDLPVVAKW